MKRVVLALAVLPLLMSSPVAADSDWPGWQGPNRDRKSPDKNLLKQWPEEGPRLLWKVANVGPGYASMAVSRGTIYTSGDINKKLVISAITMDGKIKWQAEAAPAGPPGSRSTPTIDGDNIYLLAANGLIGCYDARNGEKKWSHATKEYGGSPGGWAYAESVLIYKNMAIVKPGGKNCIVALDKTNGETIWTSSGFDAGPEYSSCVVVTYQGQTMIVTGTRQGIVGVEAATGKLLWSNDFSANNTANCPTPAYEDGHIFWSNGYGKGGICLKLKKEGDLVTADVAWTTKDFVCHHGGYLIHEGHIYGNHGGGWACLELKTGQKKWSEKGVGKGSICFADGMLYLFSEKDGLAGLATCSPEGLQLKGQFKVQGKGPSWAHPVVVGGRLYLRYDTNLYCFDVKATP
jgi:outer membrane protein assembly factor BamB